MNTRIELFFNSCGIRFETAREAPTHMFFPQIEQRVDAHHVTIVTRVETSQFLYDDIQSSFVPIRWVVLTPFDGTDSESLGDGPGARFNWHAAGYLCLAALLGFVIVAAAAEVSGRSAILNP